MRLILAVFGISFSLIGVAYILKSEVLWGLFQIVIGLVYLFGFERYGRDESRHIAAHVMVGGIMGGASGGFLALEKILSLLSKPSPVEFLDGLLFTIGVLSIVTIPIALSSFKD